ncbi:TatD family hydrolase [Natronoflexus pectinivorans]|uniref:TatD DNase family protein n=1 Tax=Natronoflexus pectinivorans TaxID=682526 RepID=A0A4R2GPN3_9BACT|nr:TatD family hydrolase [Natronoflexus pectinivorans]TCO11047.1 TatD DNase family protein [Natronoflexus pectinivorans]
MYFDFHTHNKVRRKGVFSIVNIRAGYDDLEEINGPVSFGVHPWDTTRLNSIKVIDEVTNIKDLITIGECGLDKYKSGSLSEQTELFIKHVHCSEQLHKPLIIHCVGRYNEIINLKKQINPTQPWIIHGFNGHPQLAEQLIRNGFLLSFGSAIFIGKSKARKSLIMMRDEPFFLETDDSGFAIEKLYSQVSELQFIEINHLKNKIATTFFKTFPGMEFPRSQATC